MKLSGAIYEFAVIFSIKVKDQDAFERNFFQLKVFYMDTRFVFYLSTFWSYLLHRSILCSCARKLSFYLIFLCQHNYVFPKKTIDISNIQIVDMHFLDTIYLIVVEVMCCDH